MRKLAIVTKNLNLNGISNVVLNYSKQLTNEYNITIFSGTPIDERNKKEAQKNNINIIKTPNKSKKTILKYYSFLKKKLKGYDIVHVNGNSRAILGELAVSRINKNKINVAHCHTSNSDYVFFNKITKSIFNKFYDVGLACSDEAGKWMFGNNKFIVLPNGFETKKFIYNENTRKRIRKELNLNDELVIGHVGNFSEAKNYEFLIKIFETICKRKKNVKLLLVGKYKNNEKMVKKIKQSINAKDIIFYGPTEKVYNVYNAMDVFVFPSKFEGLGITLVEAQCNGLKCVISSNIPNQAIVNKKIVTKLKLSENINVWKDTILKNNIQRNRKEEYFNNINRIEKYDIEKDGIILKNIYEEALKNENNR